MKNKKRDFGWIVYAVPFVIIALFLLTAQYVANNLHVTVWTVLELLTKNFDLINEIIKYYSDDTISTLTIYMLKGGAFLYLMAFAFSLYFVCKRIVRKKPYNEDAEVVGKDAFYFASDLLSQINEYPLGELAEERKELQRIVDKLKNQSEFGYGNAYVAKCEKEIYDLLVQIESDIELLQDMATRFDAQNRIVAWCSQIDRKIKSREQMTKK